jgi:hypothetical protein
VSQTERRPPCPRCLAFRNGTEFGSAAKIDHAPECPKPRNCAISQPTTSCSPGSAPTITFAGAGTCPTCGGPATGYEMRATPGMHVTAAGAYIPPGSVPVFRCAAGHDWRIP